MENGFHRQRTGYQQQQLQEPRSSIQHLPPRRPPASSSFQPPPDPTDAWNTASRLSRSRRIVRQPPSSGFSGENFSNGRDIMRIDMRRDMDGYNVGDHVVVVNGKMEGGSGKKLDSAGVGNWIDKYQHSDHHADRLVRTIVQYEKTTGQRFPDAKLIPADYVSYRAKNLVSDLPDVVYVQTPSVVDKPVIIETQSLPPRRPSVDRGTLGLSHLQSQPGSVYYRRPSISRSYLSPTPDHTGSYGLPPTPLDPHRRRASISVTPYRAAPLLLPPTTQRVSRRPSVGLPPLTTHLDPSPVTGSYRRASYSGGSPSVSLGLSRSYVTPPSPSSYSRHTTPDRGFDVPVRRPSISGSRLGSRPASRSGSVDRSISPSPANSYMYRNQPSPPISDARKKIRQVLYKVSGDDDYLP